MSQIKKRRALRDIKYQFIASKYGHEGDTEDIEEEMNWELRAWQLNEDDGGYEQYYQDTDGNK